MVDRIAPTRFEGVPDDDLEAVDVYGTRDAGTRTKYIGALSSAFSQSLQDGLGTFGRLLNSTGQGLRIGDLSDDQALDRITASIRGGRGLSNAISLPLKRNLVASLQGASGLPGTRGQIQGVNSFLRRVNVEDASSITSAFKSISGRDIMSVVDYNAEIGIYDAVLSSVISWGVPAAVDVVMDTLTGDRKRRRDVLRSAARTRANAGDIDVVQKLIAGGEAKALLIDQPNFPQRVFSNYKIKPGKRPLPDYPVLLTQLVSVMNALKFDWYQTRRGSDTVVNYAFLSTASDDAVKLLSSPAAYGGGSPIYRDPILIAPQFSSKTLEALAKERYPFAPIGPQRSIQRV